MARDKITITDALTGETIEREMTDAEQKERDDFLKEIAKQEADAKAEAEAKAAEKQVIADRLGLTLDELKLLFG
jgi:Arc/MetJ family transcription regulator